MLKIDGSYGEGGGQILRSALALSMIEGEGIKVENIRANRPNPGLSHQHKMAIQAASELSGAEVEGVEKGSEEIIFEPGEVKGGNYNFDIGTAGSVTLLVQALIPAALTADEKVRLKARGGTDVKWSPPYDYFENVFLELLRKMGGNIKSKLNERGHYPKGGGQIEVTVKPSELGTLKVEDNIQKIEGEAFVTDLPDHIAERMKKEVLKEFVETETSISIGKYSSKSPGTGIVVWTEGEKVLGKGKLGEKGVPAEKIGSEVAEKLKDEIEKSVDLDVNAADQIIPFLYLSEGSGELNTRSKTGHLETNVWLVNQFAGDEIELVEREDVVAIKY